MDSLEMAGGFAVGDHVTVPMLDGRAVGRVRQILCYGPDDYRLEVSGKEPVPFETIVKPQQATGAEYD